MQELTALIHCPEKLNRETLEELRSLVARYPYYQVARQLFLYNLFLLHDPSFGEELRSSALLLPDRKTLFDKIEGKHYQILPPVVEQVEKELAPEGSEDRMLSLLDNFFLSTKEERSPKTSATPIDVAADYSAFLMQMDDLVEEEENSVVSTPQEKQQEVLKRLAPVVFSIQTEAETNDLVGEDQQLSEREDLLVEEPVEDTYCTETMARIYIKQGKYERAIKIIQGLHLNNPKKNLYFADQIRFLQKLSINSNSKKEHV